MTVPQHCTASPSIHVVVNADLECQLSLLVRFVPLPLLLSVQCGQGGTGKEPRIQRHKVMQGPDIAMILTESLHPQGGFTRIMVVAGTPTTAILITMTLLVIIIIGYQSPTVMTTVAFLGQTSEKEDFLVLVETAMYLLWRLVVLRGM